MTWGMTGDEHMEKPRDVPLDVGFKTGSPLPVLTIVGAASTCVNISFGGTCTASGTIQDCVPRRAKAQAVA